MEYICAYNSEEAIGIADWNELPIKDCVFILTETGTHPLDDYRDIHRSIDPDHVWYGPGWKEGKYYREINELLKERLNV